MLIKRHRWVPLLALVAASASCLACASLPVAAAGFTRKVPVQGGAVEVMMLENGDPAVVFETGAGSPLGVWKQVARELSTETTVFAYNRSGYGRSRVFGDLNDPRRVAETLRRALRAARVDPPYVLVGHSMGGLYMNLFARLHPNEVAGMVLVDSSHPGQFVELRDRKPFRTAVFETSYALGPPERRYELENTKRFDRALEAAGPFPDIPLRVLTAGKGWAKADDLEWWLGLQQDLIAMSPRGEGHVIETSGHFIQREEPQAVVEAIREVLEEVRTSGSLVAQTR